mmetsp:Transcript_23174/g.33855  ORF Transcript_23174/g.33855 Transcript_23174/m.33855 type:complete len:150 (-) Transcript_23174:60-509(-)
MVIALEASKARASSGHGSCLTFPGRGNLYEDCERILMSTFSHSSSCEFFSVTVSADLVASMSMDEEVVLGEVPGVTTATSFSDCTVSGIIKCDWDSRDVFLPPKSAWAASSRSMLSCFESNATEPEDTIMDVLLKGKDSKEAGRGVEVR